jgi:hypothetical protein
MNSSENILGFVEYFLANEFSSFCLGWLREMDILGKRKDLFFLLKFCQSQMEESEGHWQTLVEHEDYEIYSDYPYQIRKKRDGRIIKETVGRGGYVVCSLNCKQYSKHRLIADQYIPNPSQLEQIDHINHDRSDNHLSNLRWVSPSENMFNLKSHGCFQYEYFDELPVPCQPFVFYNGHEFEGYMIDKDKNIFFNNGLMFRKLQMLEERKRYSYYNLAIIEGKYIKVYLNKLD